MFAVLERLLDKSHELSLDSASCWYSIVASPTADLCRLDTMLELPAPIFFADKLLGNTVRLFFYIFFSQFSRRAPYKGAGVLMSCMAVGV